MRQRSGHHPDAAADECPADRDRLAFRIVTAPSDPGDTERSLRLVLAEGIDERRGPAGAFAQGTVAVDSALLASERSKRFVRRTAWVTVGAAAFFATAVGVFAATRSEESAPKVSLGPVTELGGGGATSPLQALNDVWGLSVRRATCEMCHEIQPRKQVVTPGYLLIAFNRKGPLFNRFGAAYRDVVFLKEVAGSSEPRPSAMARKRARMCASVRRCVSG